VEITRYPKLALVGGVGNFSDSTATAAYYTEGDIKEIVAYAQERFIQVIPEIDMPGHASAANRAYPQFSGGGSKEHLDFTLDPGNESTYGYISNILRELAVLFPGTVVHIGGDEVTFGRENWNNLPGVKTLMVEQHLSTLDDVEHYFTRRISDSLFSWNREVGVWDEAIGAGLPVKGTTVFWWRQDHPEKLKAALDAGYSIVLCPRLPLYFDFVQLESDRFGRRWNHKAVNPLDSVYAFPQNLKLVEAEKNDHILGIQANIWTETVGSAQRLDYLLFPRIAALAESAWSTGELKNYADFLGRLESDKKLYDRAKVYYCSPDGKSL
jgi:hexosaminidase